MSKTTLTTALGCLLASLVCCTAISCGNNNAAGNDIDDKSTVSDSLNSTLSSAEATEGFMNDELILNGSVTCDESKVSKVFIPCSGKIQGVRVEVGDYVTRGQLLASVFSQDAASHEKQENDINTEISLAERELSMTQDLFKSGMASAKDVEDASAKVDIAKSEKKRLSSVANVNGFSQKSHAALHAPIAGYVFAKNVYNGSYIDDTNNDTPAFEIANLSSVWIVADVYEGDIQKVNQGAKVYVTVLAYPGETFCGVINKIYRNLDSESKTMKVRVELSNDGAKLMPGMFANVHILLSGNGKRMVQVPAESIVFENGNNYVVTADNDGTHLRRQEVKVAHQNERNAFIEKGINIGDKVICRNALLIYNTLK